VCVCVMLNHILKIIFKNIYSCTFILDVNNKDATEHRTLQTTAYK
jgi:hypothetical protein